MDAPTNVKADFKGLENDMIQYSKQLRKAPGATVQRHTIKFMTEVKKEFRRLSPKPDNITFEAMRAQRGRSRRKGSRKKKIDPNSALDLASGKVLGLKIRPSVFAQAKSKFGHASLLKTARKRQRKNLARGAKNRVAKYKGGKRTVVRDGKPLGITAWMISREIAVRRSGIAYLAWGFANKDFLKRKREPITKKFDQKNKGGIFISKVEQTETNKVSSVRIVDTVPGSEKIGYGRGVFSRATNVTRIDIKRFLLKEAIKAKARSFKSLARIIR